MSTLTSKYQATIPRAVRDALTLGAGDRIEFIIERDGVRVRRVLSADAELQALEATLAPEWDSTGDAAAYADLQSGRRGGRAISGLRSRGLEASTSADLFDRRVQRPFAASDAGHDHDRFAHEVAG